jgi:hypothetical protein
MCIHGWPSPEKWIPSIAAGLSLAVDFRNRTCNFSEFSWLLYDNGSLVAFIGIYWDDPVYGELAARLRDFDVAFVIFQDPFLPDFNAPDFNPGLFDTQAWRRVVDCAKAALDACPLQLPRS